MALLASIGCEREPAPAARGDTARAPAGTSGATARAASGQLHMSPDGLARIRGSEAFVPRVYDDGVGNETIGYGHMLRPGENFSGGITEAQGQQLFAEDVARIVDPALRQIKVGLTQNQIDALGSFIYNVGPRNFKRSVLPHLNTGKLEQAVASMMKYTRGRNQRTGEREALRGLVKRRLEEVALFKAPDGQNALLPRPLHQMVALLGAAVRHLTNA